MSCKWVTRSFGFFALIALITGIIFHLPQQTKVANPQAKNVSATQGIAAAYAKLPVAFEPNVGQTDPRVEYLARTGGYTLFLTAREAVFTLRSPGRSGKTHHGEHARPTDQRSSIRMQMVGARTSPAVSAESRQSGNSNYFIGTNPQKWHQNVPQYSQVTYHDVYPGVDLAFHGQQHRMEFDFLLNAGADPAIVRLRFDGATKVHTGSSGNLVVSSGAGNLEFSKPVAYQDFGGSRREVAANLVMKPGNQVGLEVGDYDHTRALVIDPTVSLSYSTYLGGTGQDNGYAIAIDSSGNAYVTGQTSSLDFPGPGGIAGKIGAATGPGNAFVSKLAANGTSLVYSTYIGGSGPNLDSGNGIAVDNSGDAFVAGGAGSTDFPITSGAFQTTYSGTTVGFVLKLNPSGSALTYSTLLGNTDSAATAIAIDNSGNAYVAGETDSTTFPTKSPIFGTFSAGTGGSNAFVTELNPTGGALVYSTYLGGSITDNATAIALDSTGNAYVTGVTASPDFPVTSGAFQSACAAACASDDSFVAEIQAGGSSLVYSSFLGGSERDDANSVAVDLSGNAYLAGLTQSTDFPVQSALQMALPSGATQNAYVAKVNSGGGSLAYATYLGGNAQDVAYGIAVDPLGNAYVTGQTASSTFPTVSPLACCAALNGTSDAFIAQINAAGSALAFSTYFGGSGDEDDQATLLGRGAIALDSSNNVYITGDTDSPAGAFITNPLQANFGGGLSDVFVAETTPVTTLSSGVGLGVSQLLPATISAGASATSTVTIAPLGGFNISNVTLTCSSITPSASPAPTCTFSTPATAVAGPYYTSTLTVSTTANTSLLREPSMRGSAPFYAMLLPIGGVALLGSGFRLSSRRRKLLGALLLSLLLSGLVLLSSCGSGSSSGGGTSGGGTPANQYTITVSAAGSGITTQTANVTLTVQ